MDAGAFPPLLSEVEARQLCSAGRRSATLEAWRGAILKTLDLLMQGAPLESPPFDEVSHWLAANERLSRCLGFCEHRVVAQFMEGILECSEGAKIIERWGLAVHELRRAQKESSWNATYLRVVEVPLQKLGGDEVCDGGALGCTLRSLMRSLQKIYSTSAHYKEERIAQLLRKVLKALVLKANERLPGLYDLSRPAGGLCGSVRRVKQFAEAFHIFLEHHFLEDAVSASTMGGVGGNRPSTSSSSRDDGGSSGMTGAGTPSSRKNSTDLGWWLATVRASRDHAEHCIAVCVGLCRCQEQWARLEMVLSDVRSVNPQLVHDLESFAELHSGVKQEWSAAQLLDPKHQLAARAELQSVREELETLIERVTGAGVSLPAEGALFEQQPQTDGKNVDILVLESPAGAADSSKACLEEIQTGIEDMRADLDQFEDYLDDRAGAVSFSSNGWAFSPMPRQGCKVDAGSSSDAEKVEESVAMEVAKRASWYREPPPTLPEDVPLIEVKQTIHQRRITRVPSRPRSAHPRLVITREQRDMDVNESQRPATAIPNAGAATSDFTFVANLAASPQASDVPFEPAEDSGDLTHSCGLDLPEHTLPNSPRDEDDNDDEDYAPETFCQMLWQVT